MPETFECKDCERGFGSAMSLCQHTRARHGEKAMLALPDEIRSSVLRKSKPNLRADKTCPIHGCPLELASTRYGGRWNCPKEGCTVRCWQGSTSTPCDEETASERRRTHAVFDPLWKGGTARCVFGNRNPAYRWLAEEMEIDVKHCHIGMFSAEQCRQARSLIAELNRVPV